jgi:hypothetical protein
VKCPVHDAKLFPSFHLRPVQIVAPYMYLYLTLATKANILHITTCCIIVHKYDKITWLFYLSQSRTLKKQASNTDAMECIGMHVAITHLMLNSQAGL